MKALVLNQLNTPLQYKTVADPKIKDGHEIIRLKAAALNHRDLWITKGQYPGIREGVILGSDGAGLLGDRAVIINPGIGWGNNPRVQSKHYHIVGLPTDGTFAECVSVPSDNIYPKPPHLTFEEAAALPLGGLTAYRALVTRCQPQAKEKVLISGIGGGVALFAFQYALALGADVYVTSGSDAKIQKAKSLGAKGGVNYKSSDWADRLQEMSGGIDVVIDSAGGDGFKHFINLCKPGGRIAFYGGTRGKINNINPQKVFWKQLSIFGSTMGSDVEFQAMLDFVNKHQIVPIIDEVFDIKDGNAALAKMKSGTQFGKLVLRI